jgi:hypothetical protein
MAYSSEEKKLRTFIRSYMENKQVEKIAKEKQTLKEEKVLRFAIRKLLQEKESVVPGASTGINELESVLVAIIPAIESDYKKLTTSKDQRDSYRAHIIRAAIDVLLAADASFSADQERPRELSADQVPAEVEDTLPAGAIEDLSEQKDDEIKIKMDDGSDEEDKLIDVDTETSNPEEDKSKTKEELDVGSFSIPGQDLTGRNIALRTWNKRGIGTNIKNGYKLLENPEDRRIFFDYILTNLKLYFDRFENDLQSTVEEPTTQAYEKIKQTGEKYTQNSQGTALAENKKKRLVKSAKLTDQILAYLMR